MPSLGPPAPRLLLARPRGFCAGVERAIEIVRLLLRVRGAPVYVRHAIVHNERVVSELAAQGVRFVEDLDEVPRGSCLVLSAHGAAPAVRRAAQARGLQVIDATCPLVAKVHAEVLRFVAEGCDVLLVGHAAHVEVEGTAGHAPGRVHVVEDAEEAAAVRVPDPGRVAAVTQTTLSLDDTRRILAILQRRFAALRRPRTEDVCYATQNRQDAVRRLAARCDRIVVVGSATSSNTARLVEVARDCGTAAVRVDEDDALDPRWLWGARCVGVTAGASVPESCVAEVVERLRALGCGAPEAMEGPAEALRFPLPRGLDRPGPAGLESAP